MSGSRCESKFSDSGSTYVCVKDASHGGVHEHGDWEWKDEAALAARPQEQASQPPEAQVGPLYAGHQKFSIVFANEEELRCTKHILLTHAEQVRAAFQRGQRAMAEKAAYHRCLSGTALFEKCTCGWTGDSWEDHIRSLAGAATTTSTQDVTVDSGAPANAAPPAWAKPDWKYGPVAPPREEVRARLDEARCIFTNWNVADRDFEKWYRAHIAKLEAALAATPTQPDTQKLEDEIFDFLGRWNAQRLLGRGELKKKLDAWLAATPTLRVQPE